MIVITTQLPSGDRSGESNTPLSSATSFHASEISLRFDGESCVSGQLSGGAMKQE
jgi:hypothetical protein